jgi:hypothetical protein
MLADFPQESQQVVEDCVIFSHRLEMTLGNFLVVRNRRTRQALGRKRTLQVLLYDDLAKRDKVSLDIFSARLVGI